MSRSTQSGNLSERLRYRFDLALASGTRVIVIWLGIFSAIVVVIAAAVLWASRIKINGKQTSFFEGLWLSLVRTLDPGTGGADEGARTAAEPAEERRPHPAGDGPADRDHSGRRAGADVSRPLAGERGSSQHR